MTDMYEERCAPDFGRLVERPRLTEMLSGFGSRATVLVAPSGSGKSVVAAQYAHSCDRPVIWIDAAGLEYDGARLTLEILQNLPMLGEAQGRDPSPVTHDRPVMSVLAQTLLSSAPMCVVVDDVAALSEVAEWRQLIRVLQRHGTHLIVTSRSIDEWCPELACEFAIVEASDLGLTEREAESLLAHCQLNAVIPRAAELLRECNGNIAFFSVLARHVFENGVDYLAKRSVSLDVWLGRAVRSQLKPEQRRLLGIATLIKYGTDADLIALGIRNGASVLQSTSERVPLVAIGRGPSGRWDFRIHDLVDMYYLDNDLFESIAESDWQRAVELLTGRGDLSRAAELLARRGRHQVVIDWLLAWGFRLLEAGLLQSLSRLIESVPVSAMMGHAELLLMWSELSAEMGETDEALARSRAARSLAHGEGDRRISCRAAAQVLTCLRRLNRTEEADLLAAEIIEAGSAAYDDLLIANAMLCIGHNRMLCGDWQGASQVLKSAEALARSWNDLPNPVMTIRHTLALIPALGSGDFVTASRRIAPLIDERGQPMTFRVTARGNVAVFLLESGRLHRGEALVRAVLGDTAAHGLRLYHGSYQPVLGVMMCTRGEMEDGLAEVRAGIGKLIEEGDHPAADHARIYHAIILRAAGRLDESLTEAERAFERLSVNDTLQFRRLAALEVAASLLALGDSASARAWTESIAMEGFSGNRYHSLRADMILAEIERRDGRPTDAVARIETHRDYILSENPNWQCAMYCRAFPGLLGVITAAVHPEPVPAHLLRMIPPEHAEQCIRDAAPTLPDAQWRHLGERLLGAEEFAAYLQRDGLPLCHVRLFGGLELSIGGRAVREKDWKKRKARLLFTMLAIRRGQDVPRDQLFEYLWPDMDAERAKNNLYVVWSTMKAALVGEADKGASCPYIESVGGVCRIVRDAVRTDVDEFESLLGVAREAESAGQPGAALRAYERIADLYRGDLLPGDVYDDWFATLRDHYRSSFVDAMLRASALLTRADDPGTALIYVRRAIQCDPYREDLFQAALRCQIAAGQRSAAIDTYFQCRDNLSEALGLDPSVETRALYDQILAMEDAPRSTPFDPLI